MLHPFSISKKGLQVTLAIIEVSQVPGGSTLTWDFGDTNTLVTSNPEIITHTYSSIGTFDISLTISNPSGSVTSHNVQSIELSSLTGLTGSIYDLIDHYVPDLLKSEFQSVKGNYIEKWQYYFQPLVNHIIPIEYFNDESYYEALENQLVMEMAAYDYLITELGKAVTNLSIASSNISESSEEGSTSGSADDNVKAIKTGPSEVEFHDKYDSASKIIKALSGTGRGNNGILALLKTSIAMLAYRLDIYLPTIGGASDKLPIIPKIVIGHEHRH